MENADAVRQHMAMTEQRIGAACVAEGLYVHLLGGWQGPHTLTFALRLYQPTAANLAKALRLAPAIEAAIGDSPARVYTDRGMICVEVPSPWPVTLAGCQVRGAGLAIPLGMTARGAVAGVDFEAVPHLLVVGPTGRGKTTAMRAIAFHLARQNHPGRVGLLAVTFKPADWHSFAHLTHTWAVITDPDEATAALSWLRDLMHTRTAHSNSIPHIFCFLDDLLNLLAVADLAGVLGEIASLGRAAGIHLVIGTQRLGKRGTGDAAVTANMPGRLVFGTADAQDAAFYTGRADSGAERLGRYPGDALLITDGMTTRLAVSPVSDQDLEQLPQISSELHPCGNDMPCGKNMPWLVPTPTREERGAEAKKAPVTAAVTHHLPWRSPNAEECARLRQLYEELGSKNKVLDVAYGGKNGQSLAWLNQALAGAV
jgi:hypothetical protein